MKTSICCGTAVLLPGVGQWRSDPNAAPLKIKSDGMRNQIIAARFGSRGTDFHGSMPTRSLPLKIESAPEKTKSFALTLIDYDAVGAVGVCWVHWLLCNFTGRELPENAAVEQRSNLTQGMNSWGSALLGSNALRPEEASAYGGMAPPDRPHRYDLTVYALNDFLNLDNGFTWNQLLHEVQPHLLAAATLTGVYRNP